MDMTSRSNIRKIAFHLLRFDLWKADTITNELNTLQRLGDIDDHFRRLWKDPPIELEVQEEWLLSPELHRCQRVFPAPILDLMIGVPRLWLLDPIGASLELLSSGHLQQSQIIAAAIFAHTWAWFGAFIGTFLFFLAIKKSRTKIHARQALFMSMLLLASPVAATSVGTGPHQSAAMTRCSSFLSALHREFAKQLVVSSSSPLLSSTQLTHPQLFTTSQPPYPRTFPPSTLLLTTLWTTTFTVLMYTLLSFKPFTKRFLVFGIIISALGGAVFAKDVPDFVFRYLFLGCNVALMAGALFSRFRGEAQKEEINEVKKGGNREVFDVVVDVEEGN